MEILHWLTVPTAAKRLGISNMSTYRAIEAGRMRAVETPLGILVDPASVEQQATWRARRARLERTERDYEWRQDKAEMRELIRVAAICDLELQRIQRLAARLEKHEVA